MLTKESVARDEWNHLLRLFNITNISQFASGHLSWNSSSQTMSQRLIQQEKSGEDGRVVAKWKPMWILVSKTVDRSPTVLSSCASHSHPGTLKAKSSNLDLTSTGKLAAKDWNKNTASSSQVWQSEVNTTKNSIGTGLPQHNMTTSPNNVGHLEKVYSNVRQKLGRQPGDDMPEVYVNTMIWKMFMSATMKAAVHLRQDYQESLHTTKNTDFEEIKQLFNLSQKLIPDQSQEIKWHIYNWLEYNSMDENYLVERRNCQAVGSKGIRFYLIRFFVLAKFMSIHDQ